MHTRNKLPSVRTTCCVFDYTKYAHSDFAFQPVRISENKIKIF